MGRKVSTAPISGRRTVGFVQRGKPVLWYGNTFKAKGITLGLECVAIPYHVV